MEEKNEFLHPQLVDLYNDLFTLSIPDEAVSFPSIGADVRQQWGNGVPLLRCAAPVIAPEVFFELMSRTGEIMKKHQAEQAADIERVLEAMPRESGARTEFINGVLRRDSTMIEELVDAHKIQVEVVSFLVSQTLRPFMRLMARKLSAEFDYDTWHRGTCPVCGGNPTMAYLSKGAGRRRLYCSLCECDWFFMRIGCPYCANTEGAKIKYFTVDDDKRYRVYVCEVCKGYIKTVDHSASALGEKPEMFWEDAKTVHLDLIAMREGFINKSIELPAEPGDSRAVQ